jgi:hypothetical protein
MVDATVLLLDRVYVVCLCSMRSILTVVLEMCLQYLVYALLHDVQQVLEHYNSNCTAPR